MTLLIIILCKGNNGEEKKSQITPLLATLNIRSLCYPQNYVHSIVANEAENYKVFSTYHEGEYPISCD